MKRGRRISVQPLDAGRCAQAKPSFAVRRVPQKAMRTLIEGAVRPGSGDVVMAKVIRLGHHRKLELPEGRRAALHVGDEILVAYADRYAPDQFEAHVPGDLMRTHLVASGGIASTMLSRNAGVRSPTEVVPVGLVGDRQGRPLNVADFALRPIPASRERPRTVAVIGTSMNSGKTTTIQYLVHGFSRAGVRTGVAKVTGTGSGGDYWVMLDAGAHAVFDFTDAGLASTYRQPMERVEQVFLELTDQLTEAGCEIAFIEVADGVYQRETRRLIASDAFRSRIDAVVFAAADASGADAGVRHLRSIGLDVVAASGRLTRSPLATREAREALDLPVLDIAGLGDAATVAPLLEFGSDLIDLAPDPHGSPADRDMECRPDGTKGSLVAVPDDPLDDALLPAGEAVLGG
jgi:hypothetical protein